MTETLTEPRSGTSASDGQPLTPRRFSTNIAITQATRLLMLGGSLGASIIAAHKLGPDGFGLLAVLNVIVALAVQIGCAGLPSANTYFLSRDHGKLRRIAMVSLGFSLIAGTFLLVAIILIARWRPSILGETPLEPITLAVISIPFQLLTL